MVPKVAIQLVEELKDVMTVGEICRHLSVSRSSYYRWRKNADQLTPKEIRDQEIGNLCKQNKFRYGYRKIAKLYPGVSEKTVQRTMQNFGWQCRVKVKKRKRTGQPAYVAPNLLVRDFTASKPFEKLVTDITYLPFGQSMMYLSSILDVYNGEIVAQNIGFTKILFLCWTRYINYQSYRKDVFCIVTKVLYIRPMLIRKRSKKKELP